MDAYISIKQEAVDSVSNLKLKNTDNKNISFSEQVFR